MDTDGFFFSVRAEQKRRTRRRRWCEASFSLSLSSFSNTYAWWTPWHIGEKEVINTTIHTTTHRHLALCLSLLYIMIICLLNTLCSLTHTHTITTPFSIQTIERYFVFSFFLFKSGQIDTIYSLHPFAFIIWSQIESTINLCTMRNTNFDDIYRNIIRNMHINTNKKCNDFMINFKRKRETERK